jgi:hypothetical protein
MRRLQDRISSTPSASFAKRRRPSRAQQKLEKEVRGADAEIQKMSKQVRDLQSALEKDGVTMSEADRRNKERDLANLSRDLQRGQREFREDLNLRRNEELASVQERANKVIQQIAEAEKFDLILQDPVGLREPEDRYHGEGGQGARRQVTVRRASSACASPRGALRHPPARADLTCRTGGAHRRQAARRRHGLAVAVATLESAGPGGIAFLANPKYRSQLASTRASAVIVAPELVSETSLPALLGVNPYAIYAKVAAILHPPPAGRSGPHPSRSSTRARWSPSRRPSARSPSSGAMPS